MSKKAPNTADVLDTVSGQDILPTEEGIKEDAVTNPESVTSQSSDTEDPIVSSNDDEVVSSPDGSENTDKEDDNSNAVATGEANQDSEDTNAGAKEVKTETKEGTKEEESTKQGTEQADVVKNDVQQDVANGEGVDCVSQPEGESEGEPETTSTEDEFSFPLTIKLPRPVTVYRGTSRSLLCGCVGGFVQVTGPIEHSDSKTGLGFAPVSYMKAGFGLCKGYIYTSAEEVCKCQLWK